LPQAHAVEVIIQSTPAAAAELLAKLIAHDLRANPRLVLGLATGRTMESVYDRLARMHRESGLSFAGTRTFNLDEYVGLPGSDPHSYRHYMQEHLFRHVDVDLRNTHLPHGDAPDLDAECRRYEELIKQCGGIDLQLLGIGQTGHIGFNEPLSALHSRTRVKALAPLTIAQNSPLFADPSKMPRRAITMGVGTILEARRVVLLAMGPALLATYVVSVLFQEGAFAGWSALGDFNLFVFRIACASLAAYVVGQLTDILVFQRLQRRGGVARQAVHPIGRGMVADGACGQGVAHHPGFEQRQGLAGHQGFVVQ